MRTLDQLGIGEEAVIHAVRGQDALRRRLLELGLVDGTPVARHGTAPLGDPLTFRVRGAVLALRREDARQVVLA